MQARGLLIFAALQMEANAIAGELGMKFDESRTVATGLIRGEYPIQMHLIGIRASLMPSPIPNVVDGARPAGVILAGLAGALDPGLQVGDVIIDGLREAEGTIPLPQLRRGRIHTADSVVANPFAKAAIFRQTAAIAVDMESSLVRHEASSSGVPLIVVRAISDTADQTIDPALLGLVDSLGRPNIPALIVGMLRHPTTLPQLIRLRAHSRLAVSNLARHLTGLLTSQPIDALFAAAVQFPKVG